jgi:AcrR family transcriptional regulator
MIEAATESLRRHGLAGTSFTEVLERSGAARANL